MKIKTLKSFVSIIDGTVSYIQGVTYDVKPHVAEQLVKTGLAIDIEENNTPEAPEPSKRGRKKKVN